MINKKGQSLSINTIIIAIIAVTVLVVIIMIFTGAMGGWVKNLFGIQNQYCVQANVPKDTTTTASGDNTQLGSCSSNYDQVYGSFKDVQQGYVCCKKKAA